MFLCQLKWLQQHRHKQTMLAGSTIHQQKLLHQQIIIMIKTLFKEGYHLIAKG